MDLGVLGPLQVRQGDLPVAIPGAKPRALLTMLGLRCGAVVSAEVLSELLWGDDPPRTADKALQTHISALRRALGDGVVLTQGAGWALGATQIDAARYRAATRAARDAMTAGDAGLAVMRFDEAQTLWRGAPELPQTRRGVSESTRWIEGHAAVVEERAEALLATGRAAEIIGELEAAVADAPLRERRWGHLMLALYRAGRQGEALAAYQRARSLLADELGVDPGPDLRRLEAAIVAQDVSLELPDSQHLSSVTRTVTFLLTDIEGSTAAWEADADAMAVALARHDEIVEQIVTFGGGRLIKTRGEGDATFSVFDRPSAAAAAAVELQEAIRHEPWQLREPLRIRVALHTGEAELRDGDYFGRAVNRAARLRSLAAGGQILCSGATAELVIDSLADDVALIDRGMRQLRNLPRPEHVFEIRLDTVVSDVSGEEEPIERPELPTVFSGAGPFVGRVAELQQLLASWQNVRAGATNTVLIAGEPGVGKTRLAGEWARAAYEQGAVVLYGRCDEDLEAPYQPFAEALRALVPCLGARVRELRGAEALLPLIPGLAETLPDVAPAGADPDTERYALFDAVVALLGVAAAQAPVVLVLDDLHWAAKPTLLLLRHLLRFGEHNRVQIVGTYRSTDLDRSHPLAAMLADLHRDGGADRLQLGGLDENDVNTYVAAAGYDDEELGRALSSVTGGNPFFLIEALRHVAESGGRWDAGTLPQGVREAVSRRLSRLPSETNTALAAAAVVGSSFALPLVEQVVGEDLVDAFDEAAKAGLLIEEPGGRYRFNHAIVRQSLLAELPSVRRMRLHQKIATTLEAAPGGVDDVLAELAHHYFECAWAGNAGKAVEYCRRAADQAMAGLAYEGAADLYGRALHALDELDQEVPDRTSQQAELLVARCEALLAAGDVGAAADAVAQLVSAAGGSERVAAWGACFDAELAMLTHPERLDEIEVALKGAADKLAQLEDAAGEAKAHTVRAACLGRLGRIGDCESALDLALTAARRAREHRRVNAVLAGAPLAALWGPSPVPRAGGRCLDVVRLLRITTGSPVVEATSTRCQGLLDAFRGRAAAGRQLIESARRSLTDLGMRHALLEVDQFAGLVEMVADDPAAAQPYLRRAYQGFRRMGLDADTAETAAMLARACVALKQFDEADELCRESERLAGHGLRASITWRTVRAQLLARAGNHDEARRVATEAVGLAENTDALVDHGDACLVLALVLQMGGDVAGARAAAQRALNLFEQKGAAALADKARALLEDSGGAAVSAAGPDDMTAALVDSEAQPASRRLENAVTRADVRGSALFAQRRWDELAAMLADDIRVEDRRRGLQRAGVGRDLEMAEIRAIAEIGCVRIESDPIALREERLALVHTRYSLADARPDAYATTMLRIIELDAEGRFGAFIAFDLDDIDPAMAELDARYLAGEAAEYAGTWSLLVSALDGFNRRELATTPDWTTIDHRQTANVRPGALYPFGQASSDGVPDIRNHIECVHRLSGLGAVVTRVARGMAPEGFASAWRNVTLATMDERRVTRVETFDEADLGDALSRFDELSRPAGMKPHPGTAALRTFQRLRSALMNGDRDALAELIAEEIYTDDRRSVIGAGIRHGRAAALEDTLTTVDLGVTSAEPTILATRGDRLVLLRVVYGGAMRALEPYQIEVLGLFEVDESDRISYAVVFDADDLDAAFAELDSRYLAGEAAPYTGVWSAVADSFDAVNKRELPRVASNCISVDRRRVPVDPDRLLSYTRAVWEDTPDFKVYVRAVHRLTGLGAVVGYKATGTSSEGFTGEWQEIAVSIVEGDVITRCELFDETDLDAALATFEELSTRRTGARNAAARAADRLCACFDARDWAAMADVLAEGLRTQETRPVVGAGSRDGRQITIADLQAVAGLGTGHLESRVIATRGERLVLTRVEFWGRSPRPETFHTALLAVIAVDHDEQIVAIWMFEPLDFTGGFAELETRYVEGEAAEHAHTWSAIADGYAAFNRRELFKTTPDWVNVDHRRGGTAFAAGEQLALVEATWDAVPDIRAYAETVHQLDARGAVVTQVVTATSHEGFDGHWREIALLAVQGDAISRCEVYDESDLDAALATFEELNTPAQRLDNAALRFRYRGAEAYNRRDVETYVSRARGSYEDRRKGLRDAGPVTREYLAAVLAESPTSWRVEVEPVAIRGERLALARERYRDSGEVVEPTVVDLLLVTEVGEDESHLYTAIFDSDDIDAAFEDLELRYIAGEAAPFAHTWRVITRGYAGLNRDQRAATTPDSVNVDHRKLAPVDAGRIGEYIRASQIGTPDLDIRVERVHRISHVGAVVTRAVSGMSREGFHAEWHEVDLIAVEGHLVSRCEIFDEADLDAALAQFDELEVPPPRVENTASRAALRFQALVAAQDWDAVADIFADGYCYDDRRRVVNSGVHSGRDQALHDIRAAVEMGLWGELSAEVIAVRGERLALVHFHASGHEPEAVRSDVLQLVELDMQGRTAAVITWDVDDIEAALAELEARHTATSRRPENVASRLVKQVMTYFAERDWDAFAARLTEEVCSDDRRHVVNSGVRHGRDDLITELRAIAAVGVTEISTEAVATRGERLVLSRGRASAEAAFSADFLDVIEINADGCAVARIVFDSDDIEAGIAELDARYLAGEAAPYAGTWSAVSTAAAGRYIEAVHRLTERGAVVTLAAVAPPAESEAEWREISMTIVDGDTITRCELFDASDLDAALARFDELTRPELENAAVRMRTRLAEAYNLRDSDRFLALVNGTYEDRRQGLRDAGTAGEHYAKVVLSESPIGWQWSVDSVAIKGDRLALTRDTYRDTSEPGEPTVFELLALTELSDDGSVSRTVCFDPDDLDAAMREVTTRWTAMRDDRRT
ncbi:BTAD domain-containing putative transcriptional regulator [Mycolicibacterium phlei]